MKNSQTGKTVIGIPSHCLACGAVFGSMEGHKCAELDVEKLKAIWETRKRHG